MGFDTGNLDSDDHFQLLRSVKAGLGLQNALLVLSLPLALVHAVRYLKQRNAIRGFAKAKSIIVFIIFAAFLSNSIVGIIFRGLLLKWARRTTEYPQSPRLHTDAQAYNVTLTIALLGGDFYLIAHLYTSWDKNWKPLVFPLILILGEFLLTVISNIPRIFYSYSEQDPIAVSCNVVTAPAWYSFAAQCLTSLHILWILMNKRTIALRAAEKDEKESVSSADEVHSTYGVLMGSGLLLTAVKTSSWGNEYGTPHFVICAVSSSLISSFSFIVPCLIDIYELRPSRVAALHQEIELKTPVQPRTPAEEHTE